MQPFNRPALAGAVNFYVQFKFLSPNKMFLLSSTRKTCVLCHNRSYNSRQIILYIFFFSVVFYQRWNILALNLLSCYSQCDTDILCCVNWPWKISSPFSLYFSSLFSGWFNDSTMNNSFFQCALWMRRVRTNAQCIFNDMNTNTSFVREQSKWK